MFWTSIPGELYLNVMQCVHIAAVLPEHLSELLQSSVYDYNVSREKQ